MRSRDTSEAEVIEACLEEADKSLDRDIFVNGIGGSWTNGKYRLFGQVIMKNFWDGVYVD